MTKYENGYVPRSALVKLDSGTDSNGYWEMLASPGLAARWAAAKAYATKKWGKRMFIRSGWNCYRPYDVQKAARERACASGNCLAAAYPGYSSHGGTWKRNGVWVDALAIDVDPGELTWAQVWEACRAVGFLCGAITASVAGIDEPWHIIDLDPWRTVGSTAGGGDTDFVEDEDDMWLDEYVPGTKNKVKWRDAMQTLYWQNTQGVSGVKNDGLNVARDKRIEATTKATNAALKAMADAVGAPADQIVEAVEKAVEETLSKIVVTVELDNGE